MGDLAKYWQVEMLLGALPRILKAKAVMKLKPYHWDPSIFKNNKPQSHILNIWLTANPLALLEIKQALTALGVTLYSVAAGVVLPQMPVVINLAAIPGEKTPAAAQAREEIPIAQANNTIGTKMTNTMKAFTAWSF